MAVTFECFYSIIRPHKAVSFNTVKKAKIIIVVIFMSCFSYSIPFLFIAGYSGDFCVPNTFASDHILAEIYYWVTEIITFIFPFVSLLTMNSVITACNEVGAK